jgi:serine phosphatase RsbU (regulator of sigma subunit)
MATFIGPVLFAYSLPEKARLRVALILRILSLSVIAYAILSAKMQWSGTSETMVIGILLFSFSYGTITLKNKYEKWKVYTRSKRDSFILSLIDSVGLATLFIGILFRIQHWPTANALTVIGVVLVVAGTVAWNRRFRKEVVYRKETEDKLSESFKQLEEKQREITDSINYAKRIQQSLLAHDEFLKDKLKEHFVFYLPKDIVSGDFYWACETEDSFYLAVCDSTGHGVPGAFMSLLNISFLNEAITEKKIKEPHLIFEHARKQLVANLSHDGKQDGMDGILMRFNRHTNQISYCGANNSPLLENGGITELPGDKMPVGKGEKESPFTLHTLNAPSGGMVYLCTDGFADQFGGEKGKKLKRSGLKSLLESISHKPLDEQRLDLGVAFADWKKDLEQVDDVCLIGIRIP